MKVRWRFGIIAGIFLALFSLYPQMNLIYMRGSEWNGHYAYNDIDEVAYASYVKALIDGRPRKNDPFTGRDDSADDPQPESLFSIQFAAPYTVALPARLLGIGAPWAMTLAGAFAAFFAALALFWVVRKMVGNDWFAMAASIAVLAGGALFAGEGAASEIFMDGFSYPYFPGFRRYIPALAFPAFFLLIGSIWKLVGDRPFAQDGEDETRQNWLWLLIAIAASAYCVFSYFYVWTTAVAWLGCLGVLWLIFSPEKGWRNIIKLVIVGVGFMAALVPYAYLLSKRSHTMDDVQLLVRTHAPDLSRMPELIAFVVLVMLSAGYFLRIFSERKKAVLFTASLALTVFAVFNQQIITGQSLQPIHYQVFIGNYVAGASLLITIGLVWERALAERPSVSRFAAVALTIVAVGWGSVECYYTVRVLDDVNIARDTAMPVAKRLVEIAEDESSPHTSVLMPFDLVIGDDLPTIAPQAVLWARHQHVFAGVTWQENKERYYQYLYYQGVSPQRLGDAMRSGNDFVSVIALFGWGRHTDRLNSDFKPLTVAEIDAEVELFETYIKTFDPRNAVNKPLDLALVRNNDDVDWSTIDKWYERDRGERIGDFVLYRLKLR